MEKKKWFTRKTWGYGWTPASWQGWVILALYLLMIIKNIESIVYKRALGEVVWIAFATALMIWITRTRGEKSDCMCSGTNKPKTCCGKESCMCDSVKKEG